MFNGIFEGRRIMMYNLSIGYYSLKGRQISVMLAQLISSVFQTAIIPVKFANTYTYFTCPDARGVREPIHLRCVVVPSDLDGRQQRLLNPDRQIVLNFTKSNLSNGMWTCFNHEMCDYFKLFSLLRDDLGLKIDNGAMYTSFEMTWNYYESFVDEVLREL